MKKKMGVVLAAALLVSGGCDKDLLEVKNENQYSDATYFKTAPQFNEAVIATYSVLLHQGMYSRDYYFIFDLLGNDAERDAPLLGDLAQLSDFSYGTSHQPITQLWASLYRMIYRANLVIDKTTQWAPTTDADKALQQQYLGEAYFLRAHAYFNLVTLWGRVPLKLAYADAVVYEAPRAAVPEIWAAIESDLTKAVAGLPLTYNQADLGRATRGAAVALLGKSYLYQQKYAPAQAQFEALRQAPYTYKLNPNYDNQFSEANNTSPETIFDVQHKWTDPSSGNYYYMFGGQEAWGGKATHSGRAMEYGWNDWRNTFISNAAVQAYQYPNEAGATYLDPRAKLVFYGDAASGGDTDYCNACADGAKPYPFNASNGYRWRKYEPYEWLEKQGNPQSNINTQVIRYADVLLMLAESYVEQGQMAGALPLINEVRARVGAFSYTTLGSQENARALVRRERQLELTGEQSRWFDLVRWGTAIPTLNAEKQAVIGKQPVQQRHLLLPIPQLEKNTNNTLAADVAGEWN